MVVMTTSTKHQDLQPPNTTQPRGSNYPTFEVSGSKTILLMGIGTRDLKILGTWTLWVGTHEADRNQIKVCMPLYMEGLG